MYYVSRQHYYYSGDCAVEIAAGGLDYSGCDMLVSKYRGEGEEYSDPREAVKSAVEILKLWQADNPDDVIGIAYGHNLDMIEPEAIPSDGFADGGEEYTPEELQIMYDTQLEEVIQSARIWAEKEYQSLLKCDRCGEVIENPQHYYYLEEYDYLGEKFCSDSCADSAYEFYQRQEAEFEEEA